MSLCPDCKWYKYNLKEGKGMCAYCFPERIPAALHEWIMPNAPWLGQSGDGFVFGLPVGEGYEKCLCYEGSGHLSEPAYCGRIGGNVTLENGVCPECGWSKE